ncbi:MAG: HIRAN domain-containing protein [Candidatus Poribacteria bacterium]
MQGKVITTIETTIVETDKFLGTAKVGDDVHIYRRLADRYDKTAIAMLNAKDEVVGYLNREVAEDIILPYLKKGLTFRCIVTGKPDEERDLPIEIHFRLSERVKQMSQEAAPISSVSGVGSVSEEYFKSIDIYTDAELIRRVESSSVPKIWEEIKQNNPSARLSVRNIEKIYEKAKAKYSPTSREVSAFLQ